MAGAFYFHDEQALIERLSRGLKKRSQEVVFLVGAPMSAPIGAAPGVPGVEGIIEIIRNEFRDDASQLQQLDRTLNNAGDRRYQAAFVFLQGRRGQQTANEIVRIAVSASRHPGSVLSGSDIARSTDEECRMMESDSTGWALNPGTASLGQLCAKYPARFGRTILTTNFDPLIEIAVRQAGGQHYRTILHSDGVLSQTEADGSHVIHLHGYWYGSDTLHTSRQLGQARPRLSASLASLLRNTLVVVCAYGGWDDAFTEALMTVVRDDGAYPEVLWSFNSDTPELTSRLAERLEPGIDRGRVTLYSNIDCHRFFPLLLETWGHIEPSSSAAQVVRSNRVRVSTALSGLVEAGHLAQAVIEGDDEDRPPVVEICVGRDSELKTISESTANVVFVNGLGGQGKSTLAAQYFSSAQARGVFSFYVWRDCKEETDRFETQLAEVVEKLSQGRIRGEDLARQSVDSIIAILFALLKDLSVLFVFDNVDHYVDIEAETMTGSPDLFVRELLKSELSIKVIFTCRPAVRYADQRALSCRLSGISSDAARELFAARGAVAADHQIADAHALAEGHAFWLDLLAVQVAKGSRPGGLPSLVNEIRSGAGLLPGKTLNSIWATLKEREQTVLRAMAETVKPDTEAEIGDYVRNRLNYNKVIKALKTLRALNLVVVKQRAGSTDLLELHPLVRQFVRQSFEQSERRTFIEAILRVYQRYIGTHRLTLTERPVLSILQYWTQNAELDLAAGRIDDAYMSLADASHAFLSSAYGREFCRTARTLLALTDWVRDHSNYRGFEVTFNVHIRLLSYLGEHAEVDELLEKYEQTVPN